MKNIKNIKDFLMHHNSPIKDAFERINYLGEKYGPNFMFLVATDKSGHIKGTLTDGDVRRGIISGLTLDSNLDEFMNANPLKGKYKDFEFNKKIIKKLEEEITFIPLIDNKNKVREILALNKNKENIDVLLLAGGFGRRLGSLTKNNPKPLVKIANKSIIDYVLDRIENIENLNNLYISLHYHSEKIIKHINNRKIDINVDITVIT